jgi:signal transduction histidine kinase/ActR/RegA family two-component response regulator
MHGGKGNTMFFQRLLSRVNQVPVADPVDRRNAVFMQWLLLFEGLRTPLNKIYLLIYHWSFLKNVFYDRARSGATLAISIDLGTDLAMTAAAWVGLYLIRKGQFRSAVTQYLAVLLSSAALAYVAFGYQATDGNLTMIKILALSGLMLGRRALWITYFTELMIFAMSMVTDRLFHADLMLREVMEGFAALPIAALGYLLVAIILDRSINALRESLSESNAHREQLQLEIAERERTQEQLLHAQKMDAVGKLASGIAHDINNVLGIILGFSMERDRVERNGYVPTEDSQALADALEGVELAARRGTAVCRKLLNFSRRDVTHTETFDATETLRELRPLLRQLLPANIDLTINTPPAPLSIHFDRSQFELALLNLTSNARDAMPDGGTFTLSLAQDDSSNVALTIQDTGLGMSAEVRQHLFEPFFTTKPTGSGTGLGLSVVYGLVRRAGGTIAVDSSPGMGTTFDILLPMTASSMAGAVLPLPGERIRVMLIDDDDDLRGVLTSALENGGCEVCEAASGGEAERLLQKMATPPDVLICDHRMPDTDGMTLLRKLRLQLPTVPAILISAYHETDGLPQGLADAYCERLPKPFIPNVLLARVRVAARRSHTGVDTKPDQLIASR